MCNESFELSKALCFISEANGICWDECYDEFRGSTSLFKAFFSAFYA